MYGTLSSLSFVSQLLSFMDTCIDNLSSLDALLDALGNLDNLCEAIEDAYLGSLQENQYEVWKEES